MQSHLSNITFTTYALVGLHSERAQVVFYFMQKLIVWFIPQNKRKDFNQIHVLAESVEDAVRIAKENTPFEIKVMGVGNYRIVEGIDNFINLKMY